MNTQRDDVVAAIARARAELDRALDDLQMMPAFETGTVVFVAHALNNYLTISDAAIGLLRTQLAGPQDPSVWTWLDALQHANTLMTHAVARLMNVSAADEPKLLFGDVDLVVMAQRARDYY